MVAISGDDTPEYPIPARRQGWKTHFENGSVGRVDLPVRFIDSLFVAVHHRDGTEYRLDGAVKPDPDLSGRLLHRPPYPWLGVVGEGMAPGRTDHQEQPYCESSRATPAPWQPVMVAAFV